MAICNQSLWPETAGGQRIAGPTPDALLNLKTGDTIDVGDATLRIPEK